MNSKSAMSGPKPKRSRSAIAKRNKARGYELEAEVVTLARAAGLDAQRAWGSDGRALGQQPGVDILIEGLPFQCKRKKTFAKDNKPQKGVVVGQIVRADKEPPYVVLELEAYLHLLKTVKEHGSN